MLAGKLGTAVLATVRSAQPGGSAAGPPGDLLQDRLVSPALPPRWPGQRHPAGTGPSECLTQPDRLLTV